MVADNFLSAYRQQRNTRLLRNSTLRSAISAMPGQELAELEKGNDSLIIPASLGTVKNDAESKCANTSNLFPAQDVQGLTQATANMYLARAIEDRWCVKGGDQLHVQRNSHVVPGTVSFASAHLAIARPCAK